MEQDAFPLVVLRWAPPTDDVALEAFIAAMNRLLDRASTLRRSYAVVSVGDAGFSAMQRKRVAAWLETLDPERTRWDLGSFVVMENMLSRGALTAMKWLAPEEPALKKIQVYPSYAEARAAALHAIHVGHAAPTPRRWSLHG